jgi:hypothetical protein
VNVLVEIIRVNRRNHAAVRVGFILFPFLDAPLTWVRQAVYLDTSSYYRELQYVTLRILRQFTKSVKVEKAGTFMTGNHFLVGRRPHYTGVAIK